MRICVDVEIFESGKKKLRIQKYPDTCGVGAFDLVSKVRSFKTEKWDLFADYFSI